MKRKPKPEVRYSLLAEMMASPTEPLPQFWRDSQVAKMRAGLADLESGEAPSTDAWRLCSDAVNLMETLVEQGEVADPEGLLADAIAGLAQAGVRYKAGEPLRLSGSDLAAVRAVLDDYSEVIGLLSARTMIRAHRLTEKRIHEILSGKRRLHDTEITQI